MRTGLIPIVILGLVGGVAAQTCTVSDASGDYDLSPLQRTGGDYKVPKGGDEYFYLNFCAPISTTSTWKVDNPETVGIYYEPTLGNGGVSLGRFNSTPALSNGALTLTYSGGSACPESLTTRRSSIIHFQCDPSASKEAMPIFVGSLADCAYFFTLNTPYACPRSFSSKLFGGIGSLVSFVIFAALLAYAATMAYNRLILKQRGREQFPVVSSESVRGALDFSKDMIVIVGITLLDLAQTLSTRLMALMGRSQYGGRNGGRGDYTSWGQSGQDQAQFGLLSDDEDEDEEQPVKPRAGPGGAYRDEGGP